MIFLCIDLLPSQNMYRTRNSYQSVSQYKSQKIELFFLPKPLLKVWVTLLSLVDCRSVRWAETNHTDLEHPWILLCNGNNMNVHSQQMSIEWQLISVFTLINKRCCASCPVAAERLKVSNPSAYCMRWESKYESSVSSQLVYSSLFRTSASLEYIWIISYSLSLTVSKEIPHNCALSVELQVIWIS